MPGLLEVNSPGEERKMTITSRIVAAATLASALAFAQAAFADESPAPARDHAAAMHDCAHACNCAHRSEKSIAPASSPDSRNDVGQGVNSWASRNG
jgi:hypothetical protein